MKKIYSILLAALLVSGNVFAIDWDPRPQYQFGVTVGWMDKMMRTVNGDNVTNLSLTNVDGKEKLGNTLQIGVNYTPTFNYGIGLNVGVYYEWTWNNNMEDIGLGKFEAKCNNHEISIPVRAQWSLGITDNMTVYVFTGPSFDFGLLYSQRFRLYGLDGNLDEKGFVNAYSGKYNVGSKIASIAGFPSSGEGKNDNWKEYKAFHPYWGFGVGFQWEYLRLQVTSDWGIMNVSNHPDKQIYFNKPIAISFSYLFK